jgi:hypothetical protein
VDYEINVKTDADGNYELEDVIPGNGLVNCYASNYRVPEAVASSAASGDSLLFVHSSG